MSSFSKILPRVATLLPTYQCNAECENCCFGSNPRIKQRLSLNSIKNYINSLAEIGTVEILVISGGECFLLKDDLVETVRLAKSKGFRVRVVTNGYWAKNMQTGHSILKKLVNSGLDEINISTGDKHIRYVPINSVINAILLSLEEKLTVLCVVELHNERTISAVDIQGNENIQRKIQETGNQLRIIESPWMPMELGTVLLQGKDKMLNEDTIHSRGGCHDILDTIVLTPNGKLGHCCGLPREKIDVLNSDWKDSEPKSMLNAIENASSDFFKIWMHIDGPENILAWAATKNKSIKWQNRYSHRCQACHAVFNDPVVRDTLIEYSHERKSDVLTRYTIAAKRRATYKEFVTQKIKQHWVGG